MFGLNPWVLLGFGVLLVSTNLATGWKMYEFGGNVEKVACNTRVISLQTAWEKEIAKAKATNEAWTEALTKVMEAGAKDAAEDQAAIDVLNKKVEEYETTLGNNADCAINQSDIDRLR